MTSAELSKSYFDGVSAFYSITHIPADEQILLLGRIYSWLKPGGVFVGSFGTGSAHDWTGDWLGAEMFFSHADEGAIVAAARELGMDLLRSEIVQQDNEDTRYFWMLARKRR